MPKEQISQPGLESPRWKPDRISKFRYNSNAVVKVQSSTSILMVNFAASLEQYREDILQQVTKDVGSITTELTADLDGLSIDVSTHLKQLTSIGDALQRPFNTETLVVQVERSADGSEVREEALLQARMAAFHHARQEKQKILTDFWDEWEAIQMDIIALAAEVCGSGAISLSQEQKENMREGQQQQFDTALVNGQKHHKQTTDDLNGLHQELQDLEESFGQLTIKTNRAVVEMQQQYNVQRSKLFKGLHRHMELLASL